MNTRKLFCASAILSLALSIPTLAGDVQTPTYAPPPPPTNSATGGESISGNEISSTDAYQEPTEETSGLLVDLLLDMLSLY